MAVSGWVLQKSVEAQVGTIRTARVRIGRAAVVIARARQYRTPRQGSRRVLSSPAGQNRTISAAILRLRNDSVTTANPCRRRPQYAPLEGGKGRES